MSRTHLAPNNKAYSRFSPEVRVGFGGWSVQVCACRLQLLPDCYRRQLVCALLRPSVHCPWRSRAAAATAPSIRLPHLPLPLLLCINPILLRCADTNASISSTMQAKAVCCTHLRLRLSAAELGAPPSSTASGSYRTSFSCRHRLNWQRYKASVHER